MHRLLKILGVLATGLLWPLAAEAATIDKVNRTKDRLIINLSQTELSVLKAGDDMVMEIGREGYVLSGKVMRLDILKKTALIALENPDDRIEAQQRVNFLAKFWNVMQSPLLSSPAQYHQYRRAVFSGGLGLFGENQDKTVDHKTYKSSGNGGLLALDTHILFVPGTFGVSFNYERRWAEWVLVDVSDSSNAEVRVNLVKPGVWFNVSGPWQLGLRYDYVLLDRIHKQKGDTITWSYELAEPLATVLWHSAKVEAGLDYKAGDKFTAVDTLHQDDGTTQTLRDVERLQPEVALHFRHAYSPSLVWGMAAGYILHERDIAAEQVKTEKPKAAELLRYRLSFENRFASGTKIETIFHYDGAKTRGLSYFLRQANTGGITMVYQTPLESGFFVGGAAGVESGSLQETVRGYDPQPEAQKIKHSRFAYFARLFLQTEVDLLGNSARR